MARKYKSPDEWYLLKKAKLKRIEILRRTIWIYSQDIGIEFWDWKIDFAYNKKW